ncbi:MAG TPA: adenylate kinase family protein [Candidatus Nanoarchaeia archaeon]|nr:adenylate kinase family protein [Candidatus Nanoarchaeia archaeon]
MSIIAITGSVCSGKTTLSKLLARKLGFRYISGSEVVEKYKLSLGYDRKRKCKIIDEKQFSKAVLKEIDGKDAVVDSHMSHYLPAKHVDLCIVTKCDIKEMKKRLSKRNYSQLKIKENIECEIFDVCTSEAREFGHKVLVISTTKGINIEEILGRLTKNGIKPSSNRT